jgi:hypothetical protein
MHAAFNTTRGVNQDLLFKFITRYSMNFVVILIRVLDEIENLLTN